MCFKNLSKAREGILLLALIRAACKRILGLGWAMASNRHVIWVSTSYYSWGFFSRVMIRGPTSSTNPSRHSCISSNAKSFKRSQSEAIVYSTACISISVLEIHSSRSAVRVSLPRNTSCSTFYKPRIRASIPLASWIWRSCSVSGSSPFASSCFRHRFLSVLKESVATVRQITERRPALFRIWLRVRSWVDAGELAWEPAWF